MPTGALPSNHEPVRLLQTFLKATITPLPLPLKRLLLQRLFGYQDASHRPYRCGRSVPVPYVHGVRRTHSFA
jgi:hypothetical protein